MKKSEPYIVLSGRGFVPVGYRAPKTWRIWSTAQIEYQVRKGGKWERMPWDSQLLVHLAQEHLSMRAGIGT